jgi:AhpD family alkylhydroperoxidase
VGKAEEFKSYRERMNRRILEQGSTTTKRFFALDHQCYEPGALDAKTKELMGLAASLVLRCDDCIAYHLLQSLEAGVTRPELMEAFDVGLIVGGSITIPHIRRAHDLLDEVDAGSGP